MERIRYDKEVIKGALSIVDLVGRDGVELRRVGTRWVGRCPFHTERTPSFSVDGEAGRFHCFGCGVGGDVFDFWALRRGKDVKVREQWGEVLAELAGIAGVGPMVEGVKVKKVAAVKRVTLEESGRPWLPSMRRLRADERHVLARLRGVSVEAVELAGDDGRLGWCLWPQSEHEGITSRSVGSWCVTDAARWCAQWRRMDGGLYQGAGGKERKSWSTKNTSWVVGCGDLRRVDRVVLVEGGADMLAGYHLVADLGLMGDVGVCCLFGASNNIAPECWPLLSGKRVRIFADNDEPRRRVFKDGRETWLRPGWEAAAKWQGQLDAIGALVSVVDFEPLGREVGDLNDFVRRGYDRGLARELMDF